MTIIDSHGGRLILVPSRSRSARYAKTRAQLRQMARDLNVRRGRNTGDTVRNLRAAGVQV